MMTERRHFMRIVAILLAALAATSSLYVEAQADGYETGGYKDEPAARRSANTYRDSYTVQPMRASYRCPPELRSLSLRECRRIMAEVERRRARRARPAKQIVYITPRELRNVDPGPRRGRCLSRVTETGPQRPTEGLARGAAWKKWRTEVRAAAGEQYMDDRFAVGESIRCHITGANGVLKRCTVSAIPCS
jgi:hypothetical protein